MERLYRELAGIGADEEAASGVQISNPYCQNGNPIWTYFAACGLLDLRDSMSISHTTTDTPVNTPRQVLFASLIGTTIEFFDSVSYTHLTLPTKRIV